NQRLESHAANRAVARPHLSDLGMHGAGINGSDISGRIFRRLRTALRDDPHLGKVFSGRRGKFFPAALAAEEVGLSSLFGAEFGLRRINCHAADRVYDSLGLSFLPVRAVSAAASVVIGHDRLRACNIYPMGVYRIHER